MKFIMKHGKSARDIRNLRQEIEILRNLKHENIIQMLDTFETNDEFCVVTEFAQGAHTCARHCQLTSSDQSHFQHEFHPGELFEILEDDKSLPEPIVRNIAKQLVRALHYLHHNRIIHRDMKPQNILVGMIIFHYQVAETLLDGMHVPAHLVKHVERCLCRPHHNCEHSAAVTVTQIEKLNDLQVVVVL